MGRTSRRAWRRSDAAFGAVTGLLLAGCISGPVLRGYPGYPLLTFTVGAPADSVFYSLQPLLVEEGFPIDYSRAEQGLINTRRSLDMAEPVFLSIVLTAEEEGEGGARPAGEVSRVWIAGYLETETGPRRVNPDSGPLWSRLRDLSAALSRRLGGSEPTGPDEARS
ncbi:MAG: hypothetical protein ACE5HF_01830 [Gemmatimonadota bacterium]